MEQNEKWMEEYNKYKSILRKPSDFNAYFSEKQFAGVKLDQITIGTVNLPTGEIVVCDPLTGLCDETTPLYQKVPKGEYDVEVCVVKAHNEDCDRYAAIRIKFNDEKAVKYKDALTGEEEFTDIEEGDYFGFDVSSGLACVCDASAREHFCKQEKEWYDKHPDGAFYEDYLAELFEDNYNLHPKYQRESGDWLNLKLENTEHQIPMFQSGFGDGGYPAYWGYDSNNKIVELVVQFIEIESAYEDEKE